MRIARVGRPSLKLAIQPLLGTALAAGPAAAQLAEVPLPPRIDLDDWPTRREHIVMPPAWAFGVLYGGYTDQQGSIDKIDRIIQAGFPIDAYSIDSWFWDFADEGDGPDGYIDFVGDREAYPDPGAMWEQMRQRGVKAGVWIWDRILRDGNEEVWSDFDSRGFLTRHWTMRVRWHTDGESPAAFVDFDNPKAAYYWQQKLEPFFDMGLDFLKIDAGATPAYMETAFEATQRYGRETLGRGFIFSHANDVSNPPQVSMFPTKWTGDAAIRWTQPNYPDLRGYQLGGLKEQIEIFSSETDKGHHPFLAMDTGGFSHGEPDDELYTRWAQFAAFTPVMWCFGAADKMESNSPFLYSEASQASFRFHTRLRMRLFPYIYSYAHLSRLTEHNIIRPMTHRDDQYFFGEELIVAPVYEPGVESRYVELPEGVWIDFWSGERHDQGGIRTTRRIAVRPDRVPLFVKAGAIIPMRDYARSIERGTNGRLDLHHWPSDRGDLTLIEDDGSSNLYLRGEVAMTRMASRELDGRVRFVIDAVEGSYAGMPDRREARLILRDGRASSAMVDGQAVAVDIDRETGDPVIAFSYELDRGAIVEIEP